VIAQLAAIDRLIAETLYQRAVYRQHGHHIDAAACAIRERALRDARDAVSRVLDEAARDDATT